MWGGLRDFPSPSFIYCFARIEDGGLILYNLMLLEVWKGLIAYVLYIYIYVCKCCRLRLIKTQMVLNGSIMKSDPCKDIILWSISLVIVQAKLLQLLDSCFN